MTLAELSAWWNSSKVLICAAKGILSPVSRTALLKHRSRPILGGENLPDRFY
jgi:hypothetical protein